MPKIALISIKRKSSTPVYNIGVTSRMTGLPIYTLRWIEEHNLIHPVRTHGNQRLFSNVDVDMLQEIRELLEQNVNLPGIKIILKMRHNIKSAETTKNKMNMNQFNRKKVHKKD